MNSAKPSKALIILVLGVLTTLGPFTIDMYLPAFPQIAADLHASVARVSESLSSYFAGIALGQLGYGPLLDRFGRKRPLYFGLVLYILASVGCMTVRTAEALILFRFIQGFGGCAAGVASVAMVRDLFTMKESSKVFSLLMLVVSVSPLLAPTVGSLIAVNIGWQAVFVILSVIALLTMAATRWCLPHTSPPNPEVQLRPGPIISNYLQILRSPQFYTYTFTGALSLSGLFVYIAASPILFMDIYKVSTQAYSWIFAGLASGLIIASQLNIRMLKHFTSAQILLIAVVSQALICSCFAALAYLQWLSFSGTLVLLFALLSSVGFSAPNATVLAMAPFAKKAGSASALMSSAQMIIGALASIGIGALGVNSLMPIGYILAASSLLAMITLFYGKRSIVSLHVEEEPGVPMTGH